jgi:NCS2 family nucleobase:cation symporter-2
MTDTTVHPVDERLPTPRLAALGFQHVLVMYAGAIAVPLIIGRALKLSPDQVAIVAVSISAGMIPLVAPAWTQHMAHGLHPQLESGILPTTLTAVVLNMFCNGARGSAEEARAAAMQAEGGH